MSPRVATLSCGHERWLPFDYVSGTVLACRECVGFKAWTVAPLRSVAAIRSPSKDKRRV